MRRSARALGALLGALALVLAVAACGSSSSSSSKTNTNTSPSGGKTASGGTLIKKDPANASKGTIIIGSKNFPEQFILGNIYAKALQAAGFKVKTQLDLGSEQVAFKALKQGRIDAYPEYSGTALTSFYKVKTEQVPRDKNKALSELQAKLKKDNITAYPQTPFQNTYRIASTKATAKKYGNPTTISQLAAKAGSKASISGFPECRQRTDCLVGLKNVYHWTPKFVSSQGQYDDLDNGQADFTFGFSTDGALSTGKYATYADDKSLFPPYYVTLLTRNSAVTKLGANGKKVIVEIQKPLTEQVMQELNSRVSLDKQKPDKVATEYLQEAGFLQK